MDIRSARCCNTHLIERISLPGPSEFAKTLGLLVWGRKIRFNSVREHGRGSWPCLQEAPPIVVRRLGRLTRLWRRYLHPRAFRQRRFGFKHFNAVLDGASDFHDSLLECVLEGILSQTAEEMQNGSCSCNRLP